MNEFHSGFGNGNGRKGKIKSDSKSTTAFQTDLFMASMAGLFFFGNSIRITAQYFQRPRIESSTKILKRQSTTIES
jgi:hypothetical protein